MRGYNPYPEFLAFADMFLVPADSINMTGEPCATGRPVYVFHPDGGSPKFSRFHAALVRPGATRPFPETLARMDRWSYEPLTSAALIADQIACRFVDRKAPTAMLSAGSHPTHPTATLPP